MCNFALFHLKPYQGIPFDCTFCQQKVYSDDNCIVLLTSQSSLYQKMDRLGIYSRIFEDPKLDTQKVYQMLQKKIACHSQCYFRRCKLLSIPPEHGIFYLHSLIEFNSLKNLEDFNSKPNQNNDFL